MIPFILFLSCATSEKSDTQADFPEGDTNDAQDNQTPADVDPNTLNGEAPEQALAITEFNALNSDNTVRDASNLQGNPTVIWFFPAADTPG
jgi:hypothetical protein